ncbi:MAG: lipoyl synthase [Deltaproteobacteria bacterium]|nr:lipoyl synthase [Deltaproteobacteria bacterium]
MQTPKNNLRCKPDWLKAPLPGGDRYRQVRAAVSGNHLATVCSEARCPNLGECWNSGTATFMILGKICTRGCRFCAVTRGAGDGVDKAEPGRVAAAVKSMNLTYAVLTSVTRDDLPDGGGQQIADTIAAIRNNNPQMLVEVLTPDYQDAALETVLLATPTVFAHNIETVERLSPMMRHPKFEYQRSLRTLASVAAFKKGTGIITKSSIMLGLGEHQREVLLSMAHLRDAGVKILVLGQYLQPTKSHAAVVSFIPPETFNELASRGLEMGFEFVAAAPLARTSYRAAEAYIKSKNES